MDVASGAEIFEEVLLSGLPMVASSDLHHPKQIHSWKSVFHCARNEKAILEAIRKQEIDFQFYGKDKDQKVTLEKWAVRV